MNEVGSGLHLYVYGGWCDLHLSSGAIAIMRSSVYLTILVISEFSLLFMQCSLDMLRRHAGNDNQALAALEVLHYVIAKKEKKLSLSSHNSNVLAIFFFL